MRRIEGYARQGEREREKRIVNAEGLQRVHNGEGEKDAAERGKGRRSKRGLFVASACRKQWSLVNLLFQLFSTITSSIAFVLPYCCVRVERRNGSISPKKVLEG